MHVDGNPAGNFSQHKRGMGWTNIKCYSRARSTMEKGGTELSGCAGDRWSGSCGLGPDDVEAGSFIMVMLTERWSMNRRRSGLSKEAHRLEKDG